MSTRNESERDTTIEDIHRIRREISERFGGDVFAISEDARRRQALSGRPTVSYAKPNVSQAGSEAGRDSASDS
jgi:starvation-inducible outer membrane lipoprotein